jgi:DNA polymerase-3 subunit epsilon
MTRIICFDTETTGFAYDKGDKIIEVGAVEIIDGKITGRTFHEYVNPDGKYITPDSYAVHKLSNDFLADKPSFAAVAKRLLEFIGDDLVVAHNGVGFDFPFLNYQLSEIGCAPLAPSRCADSMIMAGHKIFGPKSYSLDSLARWFNISLESRADSHGALIDAEILARVYLEIECAAAPPTIAEIISADADALKNAPKFGADFPRRDAVGPTPDEAAAHEEMMKKVVK